MARLLAMPTKGPNSGLLALDKQAEGTNFLGRPINLMVSAEAKPREWRGPGTPSSARSSVGEIRGTLGFRRFGPDGTSMAFYW